MMLNAGQMSRGAPANNRQSARALAQIVWTQVSRPFRHRRVLTPESESNERERHTQRDNTENLSYELSKMQKHGRPVLHYRARTI